jgi:hypothetical protein
MTVDPHHLAQLRSRALHAHIAGALAQHPEWIRRALATLERWERDGSIHPAHAVPWREALESGVAATCALLLAEGDAADTLRSCTPFAGVVSPRDRWALWRAVREQVEGTA